MSKFLKFIVNLFLTVAILTAVAILVPPFLGVNTTIVDSAGMDTNLPLGSVTYSRDVPVTKLKPGDEILKENGSSTYAYIIKEGDAKSGKYKVVSAVDRDSSSEITLRNTISRVSLSIPYIGYIVVAMQTVEGIIIIVLVVLFIIILFILSELWKSRDDDDEDNDDDNTVGAVFDEVMQQSNGEMTMEGFFEESSTDVENPDTAEEGSAGESYEQGGYYDDRSDGDAENMPGEPVPFYQDSFAASDDFAGMERKPEKRESAGEAWNTGDYNFANELAKDLPEKYPSTDIPADKAESGSDAMSGTENGETAITNEAPVPEAPVPEAPVQEEAGKSVEEASSKDVRTVSETETALELDPNQFIAVERMSLDQILEQARKRGGEPMVRKDGISGIDIVDYSNLIIEED